MVYGESSDDKSGLFLYSNAGHNPPIFISAETKNTTYLTASGPLLGPAPNSRYETESLIFKPGDVLVIYSDGITEAADKDFNLYEEERLEKLIVENNHKTAKELVYTILDDVQKFSAGNENYQDDKTIVVIKKKINHESK